MKRLLLGIAVLGGAAFLGGCPIYPDQSSNNEYRVCDATGCYSCPDTTYSGACITWQCSTDSDCGYGYSCSSQGVCVAIPPPPPASADAGDCSVNGCPDGYVCKLANGVAQCVSLGTGADAGGDAASSGGGSSSGSSSDSGSSADAGDASDAPVTSGPCNSDGDCGGNGAKCVDGQCTPQVGLCSDGSQCNVAGSACVDGLCEAACSAAVPCPSGYGCDFTRGVCNLNPGACAGSGTSSCQGGATCVEGHCVPPCATGEGGAACAAGQVCVNGGCIPDQAATFTCANDGDEGQLANTCPTGSTCLHHDCYVACDADAGSGGCSIGSAPSGSVCKNVTIETGTYGVCGTATTLGSDCDPAQGRYCTSGVCIDGYCK